MVGTRTLTGKDSIRIPRESSRFATASSTSTRTPLQEYGYLLATWQPVNYTPNFTCASNTGGGRRNSRRARDAGVVYGCSGPDRVWPEGVECQIQEGDTGDLWALRTFVETTVDPNVPAPQARFLEAEAGGIVRTVGSLDKNTRVEKCCPNEIEGWNTVEVIVRGASSTHIVNGKVLFRSLRMLRSDPEHPGQRVPIRRGKILLQAEGAEVFYRKVEIRELDPESASRD